MLSPNRIRPHPHLQKRQKNAKSRDDTVTSELAQSNFPSSIYPSHPILCIHGLAFSLSTLPMIRSEKS